MKLVDRINVWKIFVTQMKATRQEVVKLDVEVVNQ
jgi:hypothetical protein